MRFFYILITLLLFQLEYNFSVEAQSFLSTIKKDSSSVTETKPEAIPDPLGRDNPRGTVLGYIDAVSKEDYKKASDYFDLSHLPKSKREGLGVELAKKLQVLLDQKGSILASSLISDQTEGQLNDSLEPKFDRIGTYKWKEEQQGVLLERKEINNSNIWLFSSETLKNLPLDIQEVATPRVNKVMPEPLVENKVSGVAIGQWIAVVFLIIAAYLVAWIITSSVVYIIERVGRNKLSERSTELVRAISLPVRLLIAVPIFMSSAQKLGISIIIRQYFSQVTVVIISVSILILFWKLIDVFSSIAERQMTRRGNLGGLSAVLFFRRSFKFILIAIGIITSLDSIGFDISTWLAALGIGGIALALGAQKTVENLVGSLTVVFDQPVRVGDYCKVGDISGTIEQIGMRSTRIRTLERTVVTIPNGDFSAQRIENFAYRDRFWFHPILNFRYDTSSEELKNLIEKLRALLLEHPRVSKEPLRVRFIDFSDSALKVEIFCYVYAKDFNEFLEIKESLNFSIMDIVKYSKTDFAFNSQTLYLAREKAASKENKNP